MDEVRRLSVSSPAFLTASELVTQWAWYWELAEDTWREYRPTKENPKSTSITSEKLEQKLQEGVQSFNFASGENVYTLNFIEFIQTNMASGMMRLVRRRPVFFSHADVQKVSEKYAKRLQPNFLSSIPEHWDRSLLPGTGYERVQLPATSPEYKRVLHRFNSTMGGMEKKGADKMAGGVRRVKSMERIQNLKLWRFFMLQRNQMKNEAGGEVCVKQLFHGAKAEYIDTICHMNIDWRVNGLQDTRFGTGSYFYCDASCAHKYTDQHEVVRFLFLCQVLVGDAALGRAVFSTPPFKDDRKTSSYDSCVDDEARPSLYVLFERNQVYPEYLIQYTSTENDKQQPATPTTPVPVIPAPAIPATPAPAPALAPAPPAPAPVAQPVYERLTIMRQPGPYIPPAPAVEPKPICDCDCDWDICDCDGCDCCDDCDSCDCFGF
ncbi:protein mono-ADP-ribosyltransferase PARP12-like [Engraulis encrasicolus]|uniref:protein mono-ADP-ribosyltransferase PARP12-like n=1 Tax=Engraulis encrasicolus TaxID=184585 RepID=UPI002FCF1D85